MSTLPFQPNQRLFWPLLANMAGIPRHGRGILPGRGDPPSCRARSARARQIHLFQGRRISGVHAQFLRLQDPPHDLAAPGLWECIKRNRSQMLYTGCRWDLRSVCIRRGKGETLSSVYPQAVGPFLEDDESLNGVALQGIRFSDDGLPPATASWETSAALDLSAVPMLWPGDGLFRIISFARCHRL